MTTIIKELRQHVPFTAFGALTGIVLMVLFRNIPHETAHTLFYVLHPMHIVMSAIVTASMFKMHANDLKIGKCTFMKVLAVGFVGSIGIATLSDSLIPYSGELLMRLPKAAPHLGFIEEWWLVIPAAVLGVVIGYYWPKTKLPHAGHVLLSTWASLFHVIMALGVGVSAVKYFGIFIFLFLSVWLPCCLSDIVFPLLFVKNGKCEGCHGHKKI